MKHIEQINNREQWVEGMRRGGYFLTENGGLYEEPQEYPCFEYAPRQTEAPAYLYRSDLESMIEMLR